MATYALTFATRAAFDTSLASGDIYNLMQGVTSSKPSVAITATITESGETFACGTNVMVDIKSVGPGDRVMYDSTNDKYFGIASKWIDNNYPNQPTQHIMIFKTGVLPARFVDCGVCVLRSGNRIRIAGQSASKPWSSTSQSDYAWAVATISSTGFIEKKARSTTTPINTSVWLSLPSLRYTEAYYPEGQAVYFPITRASWNNAVNSGENTVTQNGKTVTLADFDNNYDKYLAFHWSPLWPAADGAYKDNNGMANTLKIVNDFVNNHGKTRSSIDYAAGYCHNYAVNAPGLGAHDWFLGVIKDIGIIRYLSYALPIPVAWRGGDMWSSSQVDASTAWLINSNGPTYRFWKYSSLIVLPLADLILEN